MCVTGYWLDIANGTHLQAAGWWRNGALLMTRVNTASEKHSVRFHSRPLCISSQQSNPLQTALKQTSLPHNGCTCTYTRMHARAYTHTQTASTIIKAGENLLQLQ